MVGEDKALSNRMCLKNHCKCTDYLSEELDIHSNNWMHYLLDVFIYSIMGFKKRLSNRFT